MNTYQLCKKIIAAGKYEKDEFLTKLDVFLLNERVTKEEYDELLQLIQGGVGNG